MIITRWIQDKRRLAQTEVDGYFREQHHARLAFAFETAHSVVEPHTGNFSIKFVTQGVESYRFARGRTALAPGQLLVVDGGERYSSSIAVRTRAFSFFIPAADLRQAHTAARASLDRLLDDPYFWTEPPHIEPIAFRPTSATQRLLRAMASGLWRRSAPDKAALSEGLALLTERALCESLRLMPATALNAIKRRAKRHELMGRVMKARDFMEASAQTAHTLEKLAEVACLSKYHFLRVFADVFGTTPAAYARTLRLVRAQEKLDRGASAGRTAVAIGYSSASSLRRSLRRQAAMSSSLPRSRGLKESARYDGQRRGE